MLFSHGAFISAAARIALSKHGQSAGGPRHVSVPRVDSASYGVREGSVGGFAQNGASIVGVSRWRLKNTRCRQLPCESQHRSNLSPRAPARPLPPGDEAIRFGVSTKVCALAQVQRGVNPSGAVASTSLRR